MSHPKSHIGFYKAIIILLLLAFSLSPCRMKRDLLNIFDIEYIGTLNKVKTTVTSTTNCDTTFKNSSKRSVSKADIKTRKIDFALKINLTVGNSEEEKILSKYSKTTTGNSPPKYILFKRLKLDLI